MTQVTTQAQLEAAIRLQETDIRVVADFYIDARQTIDYATAITSVEGGFYTLTKADGYDGALFEVQNDGSLTLQNITLDGAKASHPYTGSSDSLVVVVYGSLALGTGAVLQNNNSRVGGAITCAAEGYSNRVVLQEDAIIRNNYAEVGGGGVYYEADRPGATLAITDSVTFSGNNASAGAGGGLFAKGCALLLADRVVFQNNRSYGNGGGILWEGSKLEIAQTCQISENTCLGNGGGLYLSPDAPADVAIHGTFKGGRAQFEGGGIYLNAPTGGTINLTNATFENNRAESSSGVGGACLIFGRDTGGSVVSVILQNTNFRYNMSETNGAGLALLFASAPGAYRLSAAGCEFLQNTSNGNGGGIYASNSNGCTMGLKDSTFVGNAANYGGGLYFSQNSAGASTLVVEAVTISENMGRNEAGAIFLGQGGVMADLDQANLLRNQAYPGGKGRKLYSAGGTGQINIRGDSRILENFAASGGGIYHSGERVLTLSGVTIEANDAGAGLGIYNAGPLEFVPIEEMCIDIKDGLYLQNQAAAPLIVGHLPWDSVVQLERSGYVATNQAGTPIVVAISLDNLPLETTFIFRAPDSGFDGWEIRRSEDEGELLLAPVEYTLRYENTLGVENPNPGRYTSFTPTITLLPLDDTPGGRFLGWFDASEGGAQVTQISSGSTGDRTLYARWEVVEYTVTYYPNDAGGSTAKNVPLPQRVWGGESVLLSDGLPTRTGYIFTGWNTDPAGGGTPYQPGDTIPVVLADTGLHAQWEELPPNPETASPACEPISTCTCNGAGRPADNLPQRGESV